MGGQPFRREHRDPVPHRRQAAELETPYWTIVPGSGTTLLLDDKRFSLTEGDGVLLRRPGESASRTAFVALGGHPAANWSGESTRWVLTVDSSALVLRTGSLKVRNPNPHPVKVDILDTTGQKTLGSWTLPAGFGGGDRETVESEGKPFEFKDGYTLALEPHAKDLLYAGPFSRYGAARFKDGVWTVQP